VSAHAALKYRGRPAGGARKPHVLIPGEAGTPVDPTPVDGVWRPATVALGFGVCAPPNAGDKVVYDSWLGRTTLFRLQFTTSGGTNATKAQVLADWNSYLTNSAYMAGTNDTQVVSTQLTFGDGTDTKSGSQTLAQVAVDNPASRPNRAHWQEVGRRFWTSGAWRLRSDGRPSLIPRPGWEGNGTWYRHAYTIMSGGVIDTAASLVQARLYKKAFDYAHDDARDGFITAAVAAGESSASALAKWDQIRWSQNFSTNNGTTESMEAALADCADYVAVDFYDTDFSYAGLLGTMKGAVANYASLPSSGRVTRDAWYTSDTNKLWVWDGNTNGKNAWVEVPYRAGDDLTMRRRRAGKASQFQSVWYKKVNGSRANPYFINLARTHGRVFAIEETGNTSLEDPAKDQYDTGGMDNPYFWDNLIDSLAPVQAEGLLGYWLHFNRNHSGEGAYHVLNNGSSADQSRFAAAAAKVRSRLGTVA
jgi:hypothetical protein